MRARRVVGAVDRRRPTPWSGAPTAHQREELERACGAADAVVVMTETRRDRLLAGFAVDTSKIGGIPHGAATPLTHSPSATGRPADRADRPLTRGLLRSGKRIEWAIDAVTSTLSLITTPQQARVRQPVPG